MYHISLITTRLEYKLPSIITLASVHSKITKISPHTIQLYNVI